MCDNLLLKNNKLFPRTLYWLLLPLEIYFKVFLSVKVDIARENDASMSSLKKKQLETCKRIYKWKMYSYTFKIFSVIVLFVSMEDVHLDIRYVVCSSFYFIFSIIKWCEYLQKKIK